jgi:ABC-type thiamine transport system ATPase subunit
VIFDEPFAHLDEENVLFQLKLFAKFQEEKRVPILMITHHHTEKIRTTLRNVT